MMLSALEVLPTVYPRWRGEHLIMTWGVESPVGLSPLARGTH